MSKVLTDFDAISYRNHLIWLKDCAQKEYLKNKGTLDGMSWESMRNAFEVALERMEAFATFESFENDKC